MIHQQIKEAHSNSLKVLQAKNCAKGAFIMASAFAKKTTDAGRIKNLKKDNKLKVPVITVSAILLTNFWSKTPNSC